RQRALMDLTREIMRRDDAGVEEIRQRVTTSQHALAGAPETASGEIRTRCPACHAPLCLVIDSCISLLASGWTSGHRSRRHHEPLAVEVSADRAPVSFV